MNNKLSVFFILALFGFSTSLNAQNNFDRLYRNAIHEAMYPETGTVDTNLVAITHDNPNLIWKRINGEDYVLVVAWKSKNFYGDSGAYNTGTYQIWVTAAPELKERMKKVKAKNPDLRLTQLLGLPPTTINNMFIEFWVRPQDLFRPCPDKEVSDKKCNICFESSDSLDMGYIQWINNERISRYYAPGLYDQYPWTELGYTYDWNEKNKSHIGLSEFVIDVNKTIYINKVYSTAEYLNKAYK